MWEPQPSAPSATRAARGRSASQSARPTQRARRRSHTPSRAGQVAGTYFSEASLSIVYLRFVGVSCHLHPPHSFRRHARDMTTTELPYSPEVLALWNEKDEEASEKWRQEKIKDFEASGPTKDKRETRVDMAWVPARRVPPGGWAEADRCSW